jgi:1-aminocyclopropane-1-carboxylate deaminase/D-cysteine desulfhydrase-like pyridoxal-dependent ACC family enzyme
VHLSGIGDAGTELVALAIDDDPDTFYNKLDGLFRGCFSDFTDLKSRELLTILDCVGLGYAQATDEELSYALEVARATGVCLDPVYTGKAALGMARDLRARPVSRALFIHTGGLLGTFAKAEHIGALLADF